MEFYIRSMSKVWGALSKSQVLEVMSQQEFTDIVEVSEDLVQWVPIDEHESFRDYFLVNPLPYNYRTKAKETLRNVPPALTPDVPQGKSRAFLKFGLYCLVMLLATGGALYKIHFSTVGSEEKLALEGPAMEVPKEGVANTEKVEASSPEEGDATAENGEVVAKSNDGEGSFKAVMEKKARAVGTVVIVWETSEGLMPLPTGTAFAISENRFVTNAHVAYAVKNFFNEVVDSIMVKWIVEEASKRRWDPKKYYESLEENELEKKRNEVIGMLKRKGIKVRAVEVRLNHSDKVYLQVTKVLSHPQYNKNGKGKGDVAILEVAQKTDVFFELASKEELYALSPGVRVGSIGFPTEGVNDLNVEYPEATFASGDIKKVTDFDGNGLNKERNRSITHSIPGAGGASGSPMFLENGKVIAVLWGVNHATDGYGNRTPSGVLHNFGVRVDMLDEIIEFNNPVDINQWVLQTEQ